MVVMALVIVVRMVDGRGNKAVGGGGEGDGC